MSGPSPLGIARLFSRGVVLSRSTPRFAVLVVFLSFFTSAALGDSLRLSNGSVINGKYLGGSESSVTFQVGSTVQHYAVSDISSITFDGFDAATSATSAPQLAPPPPLSRTAQEMPSMNANTIIIPSGSRLTIRTIDPIDSDRNHVGDRFQATLEQPIIVNGTTVVEKGVDVYGRLVEASSAGQIQGRSELKLELTSLVVNGQTVPLVTGDYSVSGSSRGASTAQRVGGGAALGAIIGAIAGGGKGAAIGAGVGAGAGTAVQVMTKGEQVHVPSETLLDFTLQQDVSVPAPNFHRE